jgi:tetratricopeptide (TPR) repeat protein
MLALAEAQGDRATAGTARERLGRPAVVSEEEGMRSGLDALRERHDAAAAVAWFQQVLAMNPRHYGATFQLASALDAAGRRAEARPVWERMLPMAEAAQDTATIATVRARLQADS